MRATSGYLFRCLLPAQGGRLLAAPAPPAKNEPRPPASSYLEMENEDIRTMVTFGQGEDAHYWVDENKDKPGDITTFLLFPAAKAGQLKTLEKFIQFGDLSQVERDDKAHWGWNIYHYAVYGYQINCSYLLESPDIPPEILNEQPPGSKNLTPDEARQIQLDIIYTLHKYKAPVTAGLDVDQEDILHPGPLHPSLMALGYECSFSEAAILIDMLSSSSAGSSVATPGLDNIKVTSNNDHRRALYHLFEWAYNRCHLDVLKFCHNSYLSLCSESLRIRSINYPIFLAAVRDKRLEVIEMIFNNQETRPLPDRILSRPYVLKKETDTSPEKRMNAVGVACECCLRGDPSVLDAMLSHQVIGKQLVNLALSDLGITEVPSELFHENLISLSLSGNRMMQLPPTKNWKCENLTFLNLANNLFGVAPPGIFKLKKLTNLNLSSNKIVSLEADLWTAPSLKYLYLSSNLLQRLPYPDLGDLSSPRYARDLVSPGATKRETVHSLRHSFIDSSLEREEDFHMKGLGYNIEFLDLSDNKLSSVPSGLPCLAPMLMTLKLNNNSIKDFGRVSDYPTLLKSLNLSANGGKVSIGHTSFPPSSSLCLQSTPNNHQHCNHSDHTLLVNLQHLNLSNNKLTDVVVETDVSVSLPHPLTPSYDHTLLYPKLQSLILSNNCLTRFPVGIHKMERLGTLDISDNITIRSLPQKLHMLKNLIGFRYKGIGDPIIGTLDTFKDTAQLLYYLRARELKAVSNTSMRLFVIGHSNKGKTTVLKTLRGERMTKETLGVQEEKRKVTVGIDVGKWSCVSRRKNARPINFYTWDFAGQDEYYVTHQCFLTNRALYLLVWKLTDKDQGLEGLHVWLRNIQAAAPYAQVLVIGTHLDAFRRAEGRSADNQLEAYRDRIMKEFQYRDKIAPKIRGVFYVGFSDPTFFSANVTPLKYDELVEKIYDIAHTMEIPRDSDMPSSFSINLIDEKIPQCFLQLETAIERLLVENPNQPLYKREAFWNLKIVKSIIKDKDEVDAAMHFLHNMGSVLHFLKPHLEDYYILSPQWWFNACALVISPNNVNDLIMAGEDPGSGLLRFKMMEAMFNEKNVSSEQAFLIFSFLHQYGVLLPVDKHTALVPSMLSPIPTVKLFTGQGYFPRGTGLASNTTYSEPISDFIDDLPAALRSFTKDIQMKSTGLVYRRLFLLPPLPTGFWSKLITLCLQKNDFVKIIASVCDRSTQSFLQGHGSSYNIGSAILRWRYWKTGLVLDLDGEMFLSINSLKMDEFMDPMQREVISATYDKMSKFYFVDSNGDVLPVVTYNEVIEVVVREAELKTSGGFDPSVSPKLLSKALEMIDEVLKGHYEKLAENGIYTVGEMLHIVPCPLCFGEIDTRSLRGGHKRFANHPKLSQRIRTYSIKRNLGKRLTINQELGDEHIIVFSIDQCIRSSMNVDYIECPRHRDIELEYLVPDIMFKDLSRMKLDRDLLHDPVDVGNGVGPVGSGCFGVVYHKVLQLDKYNFDLSREVAVKEFRSSDMDYDAELEVVKSYADMRYELNKLNVMEHDFIVKFVGLLTNPWSFILEWAPLMSLEKIRKSYEEQFKTPSAQYHYLCPVSLYLVLLQVCDGLNYLHAPPIGIIHSDLKLSNILAYRFPDMDHCCCYNFQDRGQCRACLPESGRGYNVLVKLGDMGVSVNPAAHNHDALGVKRFAPEASNTKLTEKVDIFCLALCLYELMTLRGLPPKGFSEIDYKNQLKRNWRPSFHLKDPAYPISLYTCLDQCWQQEPNARPSAKTIRGFLEKATGLVVKKGFQLPTENMYHLLDTFQISSDCNVTHSHVIQRSSLTPITPTSPAHNGNSHPMSSSSSLSSLSSPLLMCLALRQEDSSVVLLCDAIEDGNKVVIKMSPVLQKMHELVSCIFALPDKSVFIGRSDSSFLYIHGNDPPHPITICKKCHDGRVTFIRYLPADNLLICGFSNANVHMIRITPQEMKATESTFESCCREAKNIKVATSYELIHDADGGIVEVWSGSGGSLIEVSKFNMAGLKKRVVTLIDLGHKAYTVPSYTVTWMRLAADSANIFVVLEDLDRPGNGCLVQVGVVDKIALRYWRFAIEICHFSLGRDELLFGTATGDILIIPIHKLNKCSDFDASAAVVSLPSHREHVLDVAVLDGHVGPNGYTSLFSTFIGRQREGMDVPFLLSVGGGSLDFSAIAGGKGQKSEKALKGTCINLWQI